MRSKVCTLAIAGAEMFAASACVGGECLCLPPQFIEHGTQGIVRQVSVDSTVDLARDTQGDLVLPLCDSEVSLTDPPFE